MFLWAELQAVYPVIYFTWKKWPEVRTLMVPDSCYWPGYLVRGLEGKVLEDWDTGVWGRDMCMDLWEWA